MLGSILPVAPGRTCEANSDRQLNRAGEWLGIDDGADRLQFLTLGVVGDVGHQGHLSVPFFAHFVLGFFPLFVVLLGVWEKAKPVPCNAGIYLQGWWGYGATGRCPVQSFWLDCCGETSQAYLDQALTHDTVF